MILCPKILKNSITSYALTKFGFSQVCTALFEETIIFPLLVTETLRFLLSESVVHFKQYDSIVFKSSDRFYALDLTLRFSFSSCLSALLIPIPLEFSIVHLTSMMVLHSNDVFSDCKIFLIH